MALDAVSIASSGDASLGPAINEEMKPHIIDFGKVDPAKPLVNAGKKPPKIPPLPTP